MNDQRKSRVNSVVVVGACAILVVALLSVYVTGYFVACEQVLTIRVLISPNEQGKEYQRLYSAEWISTIYRPLAYVESVLTQKDVTTGFSVIAY